MLSHFLNIKNIDLECFAHLNHSSIPKSATVNTA